jgi:hypothetical protein
LVTESSRVKMGGRAVVIQRRNELAEYAQLLEELGV